MTTQLEDKMRELANMKNGTFEVYALGRTVGLMTALNIIREYTYLDGRAGEMANLIEDRIEAIRALKTKE